MNNMEQDVEGGLTGYSHVCSGCLNSDRNLMCLDETMLQLFRLIICDFGAEGLFVDPLGEVEHLLCWECAALLRRLARFRRQVLTAQDQLRALAVHRQEGLEPAPAFVSVTSLSPLEAVIKTEYDKIYFDYTAQDSAWMEPYIVQGLKNEQFDVAQVVRENIHLDLAADMLQEPEPELATSLPPLAVSAAAGMLAISPLKPERLDSPRSADSPAAAAVVTAEPQPDAKSGYYVEYMTEAQMIEFREQAKQAAGYAGSSYKCELCVLGFLSQQQVEDHFVAVHRPKDGQQPCRVCYIYLAEEKATAHVRTHYLRYVCKFCAHQSTSHRMMCQHVLSHSGKPSAAGAGAGVIHIGGDQLPQRGRPKTARKSSGKTAAQATAGAGTGGGATPGDLRRLLSKTTIEGYKCLECDLFFKSSRARKNHVDRCHREGLQCDHCKKRFVNKTTLATHLRLHAGPLPTDECPICHKQVRVIQLKYHIRRHQNRQRFECTDCQKIFSHLTTYQAHLKYSRAHASEEVFKFPCPMCHRGYPTKEQMQDHFNYQHLGKTQHKCPVCDKPIASRANVDKHMMRVHGEKKEKPRKHGCDHCGKTFTDKKALTQHAVIHSGERPLRCDVCHQTFKQKASLYTHRKRVHKLFPNKRPVQYMDQLTG